MNDIIKELRQVLKQNSNEETRISGLRFFKEEINLYGIKAAKVKQIEKDFFQIIKNKSKYEIFELCEILWKTNMFEETIIACEWSYKMHKNFESDDFIRFEKWIDNYVTNWASCDTLCNHTVGAFIEKFPEYLSELKKWAKSKNRWMRRAAAVSLIVPAKNGKFFDDVIDIANILLLDADDMVRKGYGWMLKVACNHYEKEVFDYVMKNKKVMPRTSLRYAIEKMPEEFKKMAMEK